jgi:hypothetical protein
MTAYRAEIYVIKAWLVEKLDRDYRNRNIYILSESQGEIKASINHRMTLKLVWDCHQPLMQLALNKES